MINIRAVYEVMSNKRLEAASDISIGILGLWLIISNVLGLPPLAYTFLHSIAPLWKIGLLLVVIALASFVATYKNYYRLRQFFMLANFFCRLFMLAAVWYGTSGTSNTIPEHISWLVVSLWSYLRVKN